MSELLSDRAANRRPIPVLVYHQIAPAPPRGAPYRSLYVSPPAFARQMALLRWLGYQGLSMDALMPYLRGERQGRVVGITFDDGYLNNLEHALPVLQRQGFSSTCYVVSQRLGQTNTWDAENGIAQVPLMDAGQLRQWQAGGQAVGAHTRHHVRLPTLSAEATRTEIAGCRTELEAVLGQPVRHFCYPYGQYLPGQVTQVREAGYLSATTTERSRCHAGQSLWALTRVPVLRSTTLPVFWLKLATAYEDRKQRLSA